MTGHKVDCGVLVGTHIKKEKAGFIHRKNFGNYNLITNYDMHIGCRLWVLWNPVTVQVQDLSKGAQFIHCYILHHASQKTIVATFIYAFNRAAKRIELWNSIRTISAGITLPWVCLGDFNVSLTADERVGCIVHDREMQEFRDCLDDCDLSDHPYTGGLFSWHNKQEKSPKWAKLDRLLVNPTWFFQLSNSSVAFLPAGVSDHALIVLTLPGFRPKPRSFKYLNCWALSAGFHQLIYENWSITLPGTKIFTLFYKLRNLRGRLRAIHQQKSSGIKQRVAEAKAGLSQCQFLLQNSPLNQLLLVEEKNLTAAYIKLKNVEMRILAQKVKVQHLQLSDANTR
ncbi:uncharacterized protein LOC141608049 [Silene latifolia]|uniref:uncharacterized protein LOC141608049 n=1 Tax=Silene latifolia TaxID=37657 RepID=UPI003D7726E0